MPARYIICSVDEQRRRFSQLTRTGARVVQQAYILLLADEAPDYGSGWTGEKIAGAFGCSAATVGRIRRRFARVKRPGTNCSVRRRWSRCEVMGSTGACE